MCFTNVTLCKFQFPSISDAISLVSMSPCTCEFISQFIYNVSVVSVCFPSINNSCITLCLTRYFIVVVIKPDLLPS